ncbi:phosphatase 2C [Musa troglodytarum]|uniref:protein-serine/threonine phosphatase n=1 Tax=Musa troglodytarum TaxID=320322 RepID=A0A9E7ET35_9LILI|nr:phosphatase 2C [Musa troglodytarum]
MAEICCGVETAALKTCEPGSRAARRRRMEIRRLSFVAGAEAPAVEDEPSEKRQRMDGGSSSGSAEESGTTPGGSSSLEPPVMASAELETSGRRPRFGMAAVCGRRRDMEDAVSIRPDFVRRDDRVSARHHFFGVFDGHGCSHVASLCSDRMHEVVAEEVETLASGAAASPQAWRVAMERSFARVDAEAVDGSGERPSQDCRCERQPPRCDHVGSTAVVAVVSATRIVVANCGDSRAVLCRNGAPSPLFRPQGIEGKGISFSPSTIKSARGQRQE